MLIKLGIIKYIERITARVGMLLQELKKVYEIVTIDLRFCCQNYLGQTV